MSDACEGLALRRHFFGGVRSGLLCARALSQRNVICLAERRLGGLLTCDRVFKGMMHQEGAQDCGSYYGTCDDPDSFICVRTIHINDVAVLSGNDVIRVIAGLNCEGVCIDREDSACEFNAVGFPYEDGSIDVDLLDPLTDLVGCQRLRCGKCHLATGKDKAKN